MKGLCGVCAAIKDDGALNGQAKTRVSLQCM